MVDPSKRARHALFGAIPSTIGRQSHDIPRSGVVPAYKRSAAVAGAAADAAVAEAIIGKPIHAYFLVTIIIFPYGRNALG